MKRDDISFVYISFGGEYFNCWTRESIRTLSEHGGWGGKITVFTDNPKFFENVPVRVIDVKPERNLRGTLNFKIFKMTVFDYLDEENVIYIDSDILIYSNVDEFIDFTLEQNNEIVLFKDQGKAATEGRIYHSGIFTVKRTKSVGFLKDWENDIRGSRPRWDQESLAKIIENWTYTFYPEDWIIFPEKESKLRMFNHFTTPRRRYLTNFNSYFGIENPLRLMLRTGYRK